jgi:hemerythrin-like domain-containing protein
MADDTVLIDTRDMVALHESFRRALTDAPAQLAGVTNGDTVTATRLAAYLGEVLWLLHAHHGGEDELLYPLLASRVPDRAELFATMEGQHADLVTNLTEAQEATTLFGASASADDARACGMAFAALGAAVDPHLVEEEREVLPIAARAITPPEWGAMPEHALSQYPGQRIWLPFGIAIEGMPADMQAGLISELPPPVAAMWTGGGEAAFVAEMSAIRGLTR